VQRLLYNTVSVLVLISAGGLYAADSDASGGTSSSPPSTLPEAEVIGRPEPVASAGEYAVPVGPGGPGTTSVFAGTMFQCPPRFQSPPVEGYAAQSATVGTVIDAPLIDLPATVTVVPLDLLDDQQVLRMDNLLRDVPSAVKAGEERFPDAFFLRGFPITSRDYRKDGFLDPTFTPRDFADVDRVEVLEGPASALYGPGLSSGAVELLTKQPLPGWRQQGSVQFGSYGLQRYAIDSTGPLFYEDRSLLYRVNADYQRNDSFRDFGYNESAAVDPALTWVIDRDTTLTWKGEFVTDRQRYDTGVAAVNGQLTLPASRFLGEPTDFQHYQDYREQLVLDHKLNDDWSVKIGGSSLFYNAESSATIPLSEVTGSPGEYNRVRQDIGPFNEQYQSLTADLAGKVEICGRTHTLLFGTEEGWFTNDGFHAVRSTPALDPLIIDGNAPVYGNVPPAVFPAEVFDADYYRGDYGFYFQDLFELSENWKALAGVRYDHTDVTFNRALSFFGTPIIPYTSSVERFDVGSPRFGLIYEPVPQKISFYGMYSASFDPPDGGPYLTTGPLLPEFGQLWECGIKLKASRCLALSLAGYDFVKESITVLLPDGFHLYQAGGQRSAGAELSAVGKVTDQLSLLANYAYTDTEISDPAAGSPLNGQRALGVPYNTANVWARYNFIDSEHRTLGVGLGLVYVGDRLGDYYSPLVLPSYTRWDAGFYYRHNRMNLNLFVENIFDETYYASSINQFEVMPGAPINVKGQLTVTF
jgi:iron complex outermembrane receptor protein